MRYCLNAEWPEVGIFRLQDDMLTWSVCFDSTQIGSTDFVTADKEELLKLQVTNQTSIIEGHEYIINSTEGFNLSTQENLSYAIYGFHESELAAPTLEQLKQVMVNGNDEIKNMLVLKTDGLFELKDWKTVDRSRANPDFVIRFGNFGKGSGYVGHKLLQDPDDLDSFTKRLFTAAMTHWDDHLIQKRLDIYCDMY